MQPSQLLLKFFKENRPYRKAHWGINTTEYVLIAVFVLLISVASFKLLNINLGNALAEVKTDINGHSTAAQNAALADQISSLSNTTDAASSSTLTTVSSEVANMSSSELGNIVSTSGANGATTLLANQLATLAQELLKANKITEPQYNALIALANQGHNLANIEKQFETIVDTARDVPSMDTQISKNKELVAYFKDGYTYYSIGFNLEINSLDPIKDPLSLDPSVGAPATKAFLEAYQAALQSGALSDPAIKQTIDGLAGDIAYISQVAGAATGQVSSGTLKANQMRASMASAVTHQASAGICAVGSGKDSGGQCTASTAQ